MRGKTLAIVGSDVAAIRVLPVAAVMSCWTGPDRPAVLETTVSHLLQDPDVLKRVGVVWIVSADPKDPPSVELTTLLEDRHTPALLSRPNGAAALGTPFQPGMVQAPADADPAAVCAVLRTLWDQAGVIRSLQTELQVLRTQQGGLCVQVEAMDEELRLAAQLQGEFLPSELPRVGGLEFGVLFRPAGYVSGDIYDVVQLDDTHVGFFLADAVGHGVPAALLTMFIKRSLMAKQLLQHEPGGYRIVPPDEVIARLNKDMNSRQSARPYFASACYGLIDCQTLAMSFARAGHPFPIILRADGSTELLQPEGLLLGVFPSPTFELVETCLHPGDRVLVYSDGFELAFREAMGGQPVDTNPLNTRYGKEFRDLANGPIDHAIQRLVEKLDRESGSLNQRDDITVLCVGVRRPGETDTASHHRHHGDCTAAHRFFTGTGDSLEPSPAVTPRMASQ